LRLSTGVCVLGVNHGAVMLCCERNEKMLLEKDVVVVDKVMSRKMVTSWGLHVWGWRRKRKYEHDETQLSWS